MSETTQDSVNARIMQLLHPTWTNMGGYFNDGAGHGYVTPDCEHSVDASLAAIDPRRNVEFYPDYDGKSQVCWIEALTIHEDSYRGEGTTRAEALAHALEALLLATAKEDAR